LGTCLGWAIDSNCTNQVADKDPLQISMLKSGIAGLTNVAIAFMIGQSLPSLPILLSVLSVGFVSYGLTLLCFVLSLRHLGASRTGAYFALSPFVGATIATVLLGERITQSLAIAAVLMTIGAGFCAKGSDLDPNE
jgi:drug/metabolite transporter (DMT)-like permease